MSTAPDPVSGGDAAQAGTDIIDRTAALERVDGDAELLGEIVQLFLEDVDSLQDDIRQAVEAGDAPQIMRTAHRLKGSVATLAATAATASALRLETLGRNGDVSGAPAAFAQLEAELARLRPALLTLVSGA
jgi:HPt (histidine-containing phosphotransfer) domain-containing protein